MVDMAAGSIPADDVSSTCYVRSKPLDLPLDMSFMNLAFVEGQHITGVETPNLPGICPSSRLGKKIQINLAIISLKHN